MFFASKESPPEKPHVDGDIISIFGAAGAGKSTLEAKALARDWRNGRCVVVLDITDSIVTYCEKFYGVPSNAFAFVETSYDSLAAEARGFRFIVFRPSKRTIAQVADEWLTRAAIMKRGDVYAVDEGELTFPNHDKRLSDDRQLRLAMLARNNGIRLYIAGKRPQKVHIDFREVTTDAIVMHLDSERGITYGCEAWGSAKLWTRASSLPRFAALYRPRFRSDSAAELDIIPDVRVWQLPWK